MGISFHLILKGIIMKIRLLACIASFVLAMGATAQTPTPASPTATVSPASTTMVSPTPMVTVSPGATLAPAARTSPARGTNDDLQNRIEKKVRRHLKVSAGDDGFGHN